jgi:hypothetical protein
LKIDVNEIIRSDFNLYYDEYKEFEFLIAEQNSHLINQVEMLRGYFSDKVSELIFVVAKNNKKKIKEYSQLIRDGFSYNGKKYLRFGKSASQAKDGVTVFVVEDVYDALMKISMLDINMENKNVVMSKYEAQRCLIFSSCTFLNFYKMPNVVIVGEYEKTLKDQNIRYAKDVKKDGYTYHEITEGIVDVPLSPFDGFGLHNNFVSGQAAFDIGLDYTPCALQIRLPFMKGLSVEFDFEGYYKERGINEIIDVCGKRHNVEDIDCLWNETMFKGLSLFLEKYGENAIEEYFKVLDKYNFKIGISKYSHHTKDINLMTRLNFQYVQCLNLQNEKYLEHFDNLKKNSGEKYDVLDEANDGKVISIAKYSTDLFYNIVGGNKFHCLKFLGTNNSEDMISSSYVKAVLINSDMLNDPNIKRFLFRKAKKYINEFKLGKIYCDGFYHLVCGDIIGYLEHCSRKDPVGVLKENQFFSNTIFGNENVMAFRSPLVCQSEVKLASLVNKVSGYEKYFSHFKDQDLVMINMYDLTMPQMGGMDEDGDIIFITNNDIILESKIDKKIVVSMNDKVTTKKVPYNVDNIVDYELRSRDSRIGEITNIATSILNRYTENEKYKKMNNDNVSFLRLLQGIEIDSIKTGVRWKIPNYLRNYLRQIPYFLLFNYPKKMGSYIRMSKKNKGLPYEARYKVNAYHSCSPMNELCEYICEWEKRKILWNRSIINTGVLLIDNSLDYNDNQLIKKLRLLNNDFVKDLKKYFHKYSHTEKEGYDFHRLFDKYKKRLYELEPDEYRLANYFIKVSYSSYSSNKLLCWNLFGKEILSNLEMNSPKKKSTKIELLNEKTDDCYEFLGKYYKMSGD